MLQDYKNQFFLDSSVTFLNHGSFGACAKPIYKDLLKWQKKLEQDPVYFFEEEIFRELKKSRDALGNFIGCDGDDLVYFSNPTTAINAVARSIELNSDDEVLSTNHIYGALDKTWQYICERKKAKFIKAEIPISVSSKEEFFNIFKRYISNKTKVIFLSHITSMTAMIFPVKRVIRFAKENNILCIIDGAHTPGHISINIKELNPDIYTGACHKWMCTPKGISFLYVKKEIQSTIHPLVVSWGWQNKDAILSDFLEWHQWQGTRDMSAFLTIPAAIDFLNNYQWKLLSKQCNQLVIKYRNKFISYFNTEPLFPDEWIGQMASIPIKTNCDLFLKNKLMHDYKIQVPVFTWEGKVILRFSIQAYNSEEDLNKLFVAVKEIIN
tara:strand:+ start:3150 stop:4292 length:1143 start_codon:yes stop_codon:yes gene_type:complete